MKASAVSFGMPKAMSASVPPASNDPAFPGAGTAVATLNAVSAAKACMGVSWSPSACPATTMTNVSHSQGNGAMNVSTSKRRFQRLTAKPSRRFPSPGGPPPQRAAPNKREQRPEPHHCSADDEQGAEEPGGRRSQEADERERRHP